MKKKTGIWLDYREAILIDLKGKGDPEVRHLLSDVDTSQVKGGSRTKGTPWGPMDVTSDSKYLDRRKHQEAAYFQSIIDALHGVEEVYIFGPAEAKDGLVKAIKAYHTFPASLLGVETADNMTLNQKVAQVRSFFKENN